MSFSNPTPIRLGMAGTFNERRFRVAGRIVMGMEEDGETYYWNEFHLVSTEGDSATLVYEETESGGEWRLFTLFEVEYPLTAADAATKRVGDRLTLDDKEVRVTLVDESRVHFIEGEAPEGVEVGDIAHYFNAETSQRMIVVSWTGDEVEYYRGVTLSAKTIADAFNLPVAKFTGSSASFSSGLTRAWQSGDDDSQYLSMGKFVRVVAIALGVFVVIAFFVVRPGGFRRTPTVKTAAPAPQLKVRQSGLIDGESYRVTSRSVVEMAQVGCIYDRHEYELTSAAGEPRLLVQGLKPGDKDWCLFTPMNPTDPITPAKAASLRAGETASVDGVVGPVSEISQVVVRQAEGDESDGGRLGTVRFSFVIQSGSSPVLVLWNQNGIRFYRGRLIPAVELAKAFPTVPKA